jgi:hypothetical protein
VRLLLDAHISGRRIATALRESGHDVLAVDEERDLQGATDLDLLILAAAQSRILVTFNARDFHRLVNQWGQAGRSHSGCAILVGIDHSEFGLILRRLEQELSARPDAKSWEGYTCFISRSSLSKGG